MTGSSTRACRHGGLLARCGTRLCSQHLVKAHYNQPLQWHVLRFTHNFRMTHRMCSQVLSEEHKKYPQRASTASNMSVDVASLAGALAAVQKEINDLEQSISSAHNKANKLTQAIEASSVQHAAIVELAAKACQDQERSQLELEDLRAVQRCREQQAEQLQATYKNSKVEAFEAQAALFQQEMSADACETRAAAAVAEEQRLKQLMDDRRAEAARLKSKYRDQVAMEKKLRVTVEGLEAELKGLKQQQCVEDSKLQQLQAVLAQTQQELAQLPADRSYNNETSIAIIKQQLEEAERDEQAARKELEELTEEAAQLRCCLAVVQVESAGLEAERVRGLEAIARKGAETAARLQQQQQQHYQYQRQQFQQPQQQCQFSHTYQQPFHHPQQPMYQAYMGGGHPVHGMPPPPFPNSYPPQQFAYQQQPPQQPQQPGYTWHRGMDGSGYQPAGVAAPGNLMGVHHHNAVERVPHQQLQQPQQPRGRPPLPTPSGTHHHPHGSASGSDDAAQPQPFQGHPGVCEFLHQHSPQPASPAPDAAQDYTVESPPSQPAHVDQQGRSGIDTGHMASHSALQGPIIEDVTAAAGDEHSRHTAGRNVVEAGAAEDVHPPTSSAMVLHAPKDGDQAGLPGGVAGKPHAPLMARETVITRVTKRSPRTTVTSQVTVRELRGLGGHTHGTPGAPGGRAPPGMMMVHERVVTESKRPAPPSADYPTDKPGPGAQRPGYGAGFGMQQQQHHHQQAMMPQKVTPSAAVAFDNLDDVMMDFEEDSASDDVPGVRRCAQPGQGTSARQTHPSFSAPSSTVPLVDQQQQQQQQQLWPGMQPSRMVQPPVPQQMPGPAGYDSTQMRHVQPQQWMPQQPLHGHYAGPQQQQQQQHGFPSRAAIGEMISDQTYETSRWGTQQPQVSPVDVPTPFNLPVGVTGDVKASKRAGRQAVTVDAVATPAAFGLRAPGGRKGRALGGSDPAKAGLKNMGKGGKSGGGGKSVRNRGRDSGGGGSVDMFGGNATWDGF